jgi:hypothetical protein
MESDLIYRIGAIFFCTVIAGAIIWTIIQSWKMNQHGKKRKSP